MKKLGLISDIHADLKSLKLALDVLQGQGVDEIVCSGDLVDKGNDGEAVVQLIRSRQIVSVMGNHDYAIYKNQQWMTKYKDHNSQELVSKTSIDYLDSLPPIHEFSREGKTILVAHGTPWSNLEYVYHYSHRKVFEQIVTHYSNDITILGHTHEPMMVSLNDKWVLNPGSVCYEQTYGSGTCATLTVPDCTFRVFEIRSGRRIQPKYIEFS